ncbi:helix-turn-helix domain-containing protein [Moorena producens]|uniref:helix-turn-helix domain-containing protein n=1 Tax=Moorena producens TaxID=1155739 RepID=UPI003C74D878
MSKKKRNTNSKRLSDVGIEAARRALGEKGWTQEKLANLSCTSVSTVKRLLRGKNISPSCFYALMGKLNLEVKDGYIRQKTNTDIFPWILSPKDTSFHQLPGVLMIGKFTENKLPRIERTLEQLGSLLIDSKITINKEREMITVHGEFSEEKKELIEETIAHLEQLLEYSHVTW